MILGPVIDQHEDARRAGLQSFERFAYTEAVSQLSSALEFLKHLPDDTERACTELSIQTGLGQSLAAEKGFAAAELEPVYARARELCAQIRAPALAFWPLRLQRLMRWWKLELRDALELADELLAAAEDMKAPAMLLAGNSERGTILLLLGELISAGEHLKKALAVSDLHPPV